MKLAVMSDIHGNLPALKLVIEDIVKQKADEIYSLGDQVGLFPRLGEVLDLLDEHGVTCLSGNFEESNFDQTDDRFLRWIAEQKGDRDFGILPCVLRIEREGVQIVMTHKEEDAECPEGGLHLFGHTHKDFYERGKSKILLNPGSVGTPRGIINLPEARYALLEINDGIIQITHRSLTYSAEPIWRDFIDSGCYEVNPFLSRLIMEMICTGESNALIGRFFRHAKSMISADGTDNADIPAYPHNIWEKAAESFSWMLPNKFEDLLNHGGKLF
ncbi:MAG: metallophosphoesterase family protein [Oscillospiraceae bacterium]|nr:metallophosphoesterase family protein [Oscillospiraceae bacterium]